MLTRPFVPDYATHNAHMYYVKLADLEARDPLYQLSARARYLGGVPLCTAALGGCRAEIRALSGEDVYTTKESERLVRLPMYYNLEMEQVEYIADTILKYQNW